MARAIGWLLLILVAGIAALVLWQGRDLDAARDGDLADAPPAMAEDENSFPLLVAATERVALTEEEAEAVVAMLEAGAYEAESGRALLARNAAALAGLDRVLARPGLRPPPVVHVDDEFWDFVPAVALVRLQALRALARAEAGNGSAAFADVRSILVLAERLGGDGYAGLVNLSIALAWQETAGRTLIHAVPSLAIGAEQSLAWSDALRALAPSDSAWRAAWAAEYRLMRGAMDDLGALEGSGAPEAARRLVPSYFYQPFRTRALYAERIRGVQQQGEVPCRDLPPEPEREDRIFPLAPNAVGRILVAVAAPEAGRTLERRCRVTAQLEAARALLALHAFERETGALPDDLLELVPAHLGGVPRDPFDGEPLRYDRAGRRIASVGADDAAPLGWTLPPAP